MRIVTDGTLFAIEKGWLFKRYRSIYVDYWWNYEESFDYCWGTQEQIKYLWNRIHNKGNFKIIKQEDL